MNHQRIFQSDAYLLCGATDPILKGTQLSSRFVRHPQLCTLMQARNLYADLHGMRSSSGAPNMDKVLCPSVDPLASIPSGV